MLREDSHRTGTAQSPVCQCGFETESAEHYLHCTRFREARNKLKDMISESSALKKRLQLSDLCRWHQTVIWLPESRICGLRTHFLNSLLNADTQVKLS